MVEGTRGIDFLFGIIIAVVCANWVAQFIHKDGVYESELDHDGNVFFLRTEAPHALQYKTAGEVGLTHTVRLLHHLSSACAVGLMNTAHGQNFMTMLVWEPWYLFTADTLEWLGIFRAYIGHIQGIYRVYIGCI